MLEQHESALNGLRVGLVDLEQLPSYMMLVHDPLHGTTKAKVGSAANAAADLWALINAADRAVSEMRNYANVNGVRARHKMELARMLTERWVTVDLATPPGEQRLSISDVMAMIRSRYDAIREKSTEITDLFVAILPRVDAAKGTLNRLDTEAGQLGVIEPLIGRARALADDLELRLSTDPLSVLPADGANLDSAVSAAAKQLESLRRGRDALDADLASTEGLLADLRVTLARAEASANEARTKVGGLGGAGEPDGLVRVPSVAVIDGDNGLAARLDEINRLTAVERAWTQRRSLLDTWLATANKLLDQLRKAEKANRRPLERRDELRGRLQAYRAKMAATGKAEDLALTALADEARAALFTAPADLDKAATTMNELAGRL